MRQRIVRSKEDREKLFGKPHDETNGPRIPDPVEERRGWNMSKNHPLLEPNDILPDSAIMSSRPPGYYLIQELGRQRRLRQLLKSRGVEEKPLTADDIEKWAAEPDKPKGYLWQIPGFKTRIYQIHGLLEVSTEPGENFLSALYSFMYQSYIIGENYFDFHRDVDIPKLVRECERTKVEEPGFFDKVPGLKEKINYFYWLDVK